MFFKPYIWYGAEIAATWPEGNLPKGYLLLINSGGAQIETHSYHRPDFCLNYYKNDKFMIIKLP